jgi:hypothetical protein
MKKSKFETKWRNPKSFNIERFVFVTLFDENIFILEKDTKCKKIAYITTVNENFTEKIW